jgi:hypothetical protein
MRTLDLPREHLEEALIKLGIVIGDGVEQVSLVRFMEGKNGCEYHEHTRSNMPCYKTQLGD